MSPTPIILAQFGCGYWGPNLLRNFSAIQDCHVKYLVDTSEERCRFVKKNFPSTKPIANPEEVWNDTTVDGVIIATPAGSHFELAKTALESGKHVFVEKPLATRVTDVEVLGELGRKMQRVVMAGHTFLYNSAVRYVKELIDNGEIGTVQYIYSQRLNLGRIRSDIDALWNLGPHDISIIHYWLNNPLPLQVARQGMAYVQPGVDDVVFLNITYPSKVMANIHVSWLDPQKVRKMIVVGSKKMVVYDDIAEDKIAIYDKGIDQIAKLGENMDFDAPRFSFTYRSGDVLLPGINWVEPLRCESEHFIHCIRTGEQPLTGIAHARSVVAVLERAQAIQPDKV